MDVGLRQLHKKCHVYSMVTHLAIETDSIHELPKEVSKFRNLIFLNVQGSRFWDLKMTQVPVSVRFLYFISLSNLTCSCLEGMEKLIQLEELHIDVGPWQLDKILLDQELDDLEYETRIPFAYIPHLRSITFYIGYPLDNASIEPGWEKRIKSHWLFDQTRCTIKSITYTGEMGFTIEMNKVFKSNLIRKLNSMTR
jgi:hypothetical protein